jgi:hypothetical protein
MLVHAGVQCKACVFSGLPTPGARIWDGVRAGGHWSVEWERLAGLQDAMAQAVAVSDDTLAVDLVDKDMRVAGLLEGKRSGETQESLRRWLSQRVR